MSNNDKPLKDRGKGLEDEWIRQREAEQREHPDSPANPELPKQRELPDSPPNPEPPEAPVQGPKKDNDPGEPAPKKREPLWPLFLALLALGSVISMIWFH
jgi:hypothetical protein